MMVSKKPESLFPGADVQVPAAKLQLCKIRYTKLVYRGSHILMAENWRGFLSAGIYKLPCSLLDGQKENNYTV